MSRFLRLAVPNNPRPVEENKKQLLLAEVSDA